jgi:protein phosphatase
MPAGVKTKPKAFRIQAACATDTGRVREANEDSHLLALERRMFIVSDGMGGHQAGAVASKAVVTLLPELIDRELRGARGVHDHLMEQALRDAIAQLSERLRDESAGRQGLQGMGATVALAWLRGGKAHLAHMGDSRIYLFRGGRLRQLTEDHSVVALLLKHGEVTAQEAQHHPARGKLSRYVGIEGEVFADVSTVPLRDGDRLLLCSDGLTGMLDDDRITRTLAAQRDCQAACDALVAAANEAGGKDNITVLVVECKRNGNRNAGSRG